MNLTICLKGTRTKKGQTYTFTKEEYIRFRTDFEDFITAGTPKGGAYNYQPQSEEIGPQVIKVLFIEFASVALIDVQVKLDRLNELTRDVEEARLINQRARTQNEESKKSNSLWLGQH